MKELDKVNKAVNFLINEGFENPNYAVILGTGLKNFVNHINVIKSIEYSKIPHFVDASVESHKGVLHIAHFHSHRIIIMEGRFHYYEGHSMKEIVFPIRVFSKLGILLKGLFIFNAAGCINLNWSKGDIMLINDHINLLPDNPLRDKESRDFGPIFVDMSKPYSEELSNKIRSKSAKNGIQLKEGVYVAVTGPSLETRAEYRYLHTIGADAVGMSTVPEVIAARQLNIDVCGISILTDLCDPDNLSPIDITDILSTAHNAEKKLITLMTDFFQS